ncbi:DUF3298 and DUF4163 domain-containing protein [Bacillus sp. Bva_UNVM-123]|uniref:DUF3298 and DUF4163 domain-containing protein n=1 Tax=Bacillus sp. Bva_UNVM-123 TaxID=2829798 RepID=UPI00391FBC57
MKKLISLLVVAVLIIFLQPNPSAHASVMWGKTELKKGQIGKVTLLQNSQLWKLSEDNKSLVEVRKLKQGEEYRVYTYKNQFGGLYGVGGGAFIKKSAAINYQTPAKSKLQTLGVKIVDSKYKDTFNYPQVEGLINNTAQKKINEVLQKHIASSYTNALELKKLEAEHGAPQNQYTHEVKYEIKYNQNNLLSILFFDYEYTGGAHGMTAATSYNFDANTGNEISLTKVVENNNAVTKVKKFAKIDLLNQGNKLGMTYVSDPASITINDNRPFYFYDKGIVLKFQQYEVAPYAAGMPEVIIPYSVFK